MSLPLLIIFMVAQRKIISGITERSRQVTVASERTAEIENESDTEAPRRSPTSLARAGVSVPTVSRVLTGALHGDPGEARSRRSKRDRGTELPPERRRPSARVAQGAGDRRVAGDTSRYGYAETIRGIEEAARADGYTVMITVVESADDDEIDRAIAATLSQPLAGVVVLKFDPPGVAALQHVPDGPSAGRPVGRARARACPRRCSTRRMPPRSSPTTFSGSGTRPCTTCASPRRARRTAAPPAGAARSAEPGRPSRSRSTRPGSPRAARHSERLWPRTPT